MASNSFSQFDLYGERTDELLSFLNEDIQNIEDMVDGPRQPPPILFQHIDYNFTTKEFQLPSVGKEYQWINTERPLSFEGDLQNKVFIMDFFTYCCINCIHILPYLKKVEEKHADNPGFAVIGIHSAKFPNERNVEKVKDAVLRHDIKHPILNDPDCTLWKTFNISCWPTVFIVGPDRVLLFILIGEKQIEKLPFLCDIVLQRIGFLSLELDPCFLPICQVKGSEKFTELLYPSNVSIDGDKENILVSDTGHNRLLLLSRSLETRDIIGSGAVGHEDGPFETCSFNSPRGTTWYNNVTVFVADTGNHMIRKVCFNCRDVRTVYDGRETSVDCGREDGQHAKFRSPWDLCMGYLFGTTEKKLDVLYIAVAGSHQIWSFDINEHRNDDCLPFAGSGNEENRANRYRLRAGFAQPSGITYNHTLMPDKLFVADSESSTIKTVSLIDGSVTNVVGGGLDPLDLFQFGDKDGKKREVKLQHPMAVCILDPRTLIIADTYNHKIKLIDVTDSSCRTVLIDKGLNEPSGICVCDDSLFVADTNNHRIVTLPLREIFSQVIPANYDLEVVLENLSIGYDPQTSISVANNGRIFCQFSFDSGEKYAMNELGLQNLDISFKGNKLDVVYKNKRFFGESQPSLILKQVCDLDKVSVLHQPTEIILILSIPLCDKQVNTCCYKNVLFKIFIENKPSTTETVYIKFNLSDELKLF